MTTTINNLKEDIKCMKAAKARHRELAKWGNVESRERARELNYSIKEAQAVISVAKSMGATPTTRFDYEIPLFSSKVIIKFQ